MIRYINCKKNKAPIVPVVPKPSSGLYATGAFTTITASAEPIVGYIARWTGTTWVSLKTGLNTAGTAICLGRDNNIYVGGNFTTADGITVNRIAKWNGVSWSALGSGLSGAVNGICSSTVDNSIYVTGSFATASGTTVNNIAKWNGSAWSALGSGLNGVGWSVCSDISGNVYASGEFTAAGGVTLNRIAKWNGSAWSALGNGITTPGSSGYHANGMCMGANNYLYLTGEFLGAGSQTNTAYIAAWNPATSAWGSLGIPGLTATGRGICRNNNGIYVVGDFTKAFGTTVSYVFNYNDANTPKHRALASGLNGKTYCVCSDANNNIYIGGVFNSTQYNASQTPNSTTANRIIKWNGSSWSTFGTGGLPGLNAAVNGVLFVD